MKELTIALVILVSIICLLVIYISILQWQLHSINRQLGKRLTKGTRQPVSLELINRELNQLAANINKCLKAEETLRLESVREEKRFKELIANISHDLRTPLTAVKGYLQLMERGELNEEQARKLHISMKHTEKLEKLINHFFEYSYLVSAETEPQLKKINLSNLVADCLADSVNQFEEKGISVEFEPDEAFFVLADIEMTTRIVQNLIRNCIAHSYGNVGVSILQDKNIVLEFSNYVSDCNEIDIKRLFERFYTADKSRHNTTGIGLSIVKLLAERMGGNATAELRGSELAIRVAFTICKL